MAAEYYHEVGLSEKAKDIHRALTSFSEELEAIDWYNQRADVSGDEELKAILIHNRDEEIEHATMILEWLRRNIPHFDTTLRTYLFTTAPVTEIEAAANGNAGTAPATASFGALKIGKL